MRKAVLALLGFVMFALLFLLAAIAGGNTSPGVVILIVIGILGAGYLWLKLRATFHRKT